MAPATDRFVFAFAAIGMGVLAALPLPGLAQDAASGGDHSAVLSVERVFADPDLAGAVARGVSLSPDGELVAYLRSRDDDADVLDLWAAPTTGGGEPVKLVDARALVPDEGDLSEAEQARRERLRISRSGVVEYAWDEQGRFILAPIGGDLFLADRADGSVRRLTETESDEIDAKVSPLGHFVSFVRDRNLFIVELAGGAERPITEDGGGLVTWATAEFIAQEEMDRDTGYWWSPDERRIVLQRTDESPVDIVPRLEISGGGLTTADQRYPRAGRPNALVELHVHDLRSGDRVRVDLGEDSDIYLARVDWSADGATLYVQRQSRDQKRLDLLAVDPATGRSRIIASQQDPAWVGLSHDFRPLADGRFLWSSEEDGWRHLRLHDADGRVLRRLTQGEWAVKQLEGVNEATGEVFFIASMRDGREFPTEQQLFRVSLDEPSDPVAVTPAGGWWTVAMNKRANANAFVGTYTDLGTPPRTALYRTDGTFVRWIEENRLDESHPFQPYLSRRPEMEFGTLKSHGETLVWMLAKPPNFDSARPHPVVIQVYGGPSGGGVRNAWLPPTTQLLTEAGYLVFRLDNRGEGARSAAFKRAIHRRLGVPEIEDQVMAADFLRSLPSVDGARIAAMGWSYGGFMTLHMLTEPRMALAAAISGAPPTDWRLYDTHYTERFMETPEANPDGYARADVVLRLDDLTGRLLLLHGMADDNVVFENSTRLIEAMQEQSISFEMMLYPGQRHGVRGNPRRLQLWRTLLDFLDRTIGEETGTK